MRDIDGQYIPKSFRKEWQDLAKNKHRELAGKTWDKQIDAITKSQKIDVIIEKQAIA